MSSLSDLILGRPVGGQIRAMMGERQAWAVEAPRGMLTGMKAYLTGRTLPLMASGVMLLAAACSGAATPTQPATFDGAGDLTIALAQQLRDVGFEVEEAGEVSCPLFSGVGFELFLGDESLETLEYQDEAALEADASRVSEDGMRIETVVGGQTSVTDIAFNSPPHYFSRDRMLVMYVGDDATLLTALEELMGPQFAGQ